MCISRVSDLALRHEVPTPRPPRLLVISQVYMPDPAAVGQYLTDAAEEMVSRGWEVVVYTAARGYDDPTVRYVAREQRNGVRIYRLPFSSFGKRSIATRLIAQSLFVTQAFIMGLCSGRCAAILVSTSPPFAGFCGALLSLLKRAPFIWWVMDLNPDQMVAGAKLPAGSILVRIFDWLNRITIQVAASIIVLDRFMKERLVRKLPVGSVLADKIHVLPPWSLDAHVGAAPADGIGFRKEHGLENRFVVMYSGNHSEQNPLTTLLEAAQRLVALESVVFVFVGGGIGKAEVDRRIASGARNIVSLPYQRVERLSDSLRAADVHVVSIGDSMVGIAHPCKIYTAMAVGKPILLFGPTSCHASDILAMDEIGWHVAHGDVSLAESRLRAAYSMSPAQRQTMGTKAAAVAASAFSRHYLIEQFAEVVEGARSAGLSPARQASKTGRGAPGPYRRATAHRN